MCKNRSIKYACGHAFYFNLSTCRGTFTMQSKPTRPPKPMCSTTALVILRSTSMCGPCQSTQEENAMEKEIQACHLLDSMDGTLDGSMDMNDLLEQKNHFLHQLGKRFPKTQQFKSFVRPEHGRRAIELGGSRLREDMTPPEDDAGEGFIMTAEDEESAAYFDEWADPWGPCTASTTTWQDAEEEQPSLMAYEDVADSNDSELQIVNDLSASDEPASIEAAFESFVLEPQEENINPSSGEKLSILPPHRRRLKSFPLTAKAAQSEAADPDIDVLERWRCLVTSIMVK